MGLVQEHTPNPGIFLSKSTFRLEGIVIIPYYLEKLYGVFNVIIEIQTGTFKTYSVMIILVTAY